MRVMAQMSMHPRWTLQLDNDEMKLVTLALAGKLKTVEQQTEAKVLLEAMTRQRLAVATEQTETLQRYLPTSE